MTSESARISLLGLRLFLALVFLGLSGCSTATDFVAARFYRRHGDLARVVIDLREEQAYLFRGTKRIAAARISSGREGREIPVGQFRVTRKDANRRSKLYGQYADDDGRIVESKVNVRRDRRPLGTYFVGWPMPFFVEFAPGYGLHAGYLPGLPPSHGSIRMSYAQARQFYRAVRIGTPVEVKP